MTVAEKLTTIAENEQKVFDAGKKAEYDALWDAVQDYGNRDSYSDSFANWGAEYIRPKYKVVARSVSDAEATFNCCYKLRKVESAYFDFSQKPTGTTNKHGYYYTFNNCYKLEEIEDIGLVPQGWYVYTFANCSALHTIAKIGVDENTSFSNTFKGCSKLKYLFVHGVIGQNGFSVDECNELTHDSLMSIINALQTKTSGTWSVALGNSNLAKLTDAEKAIATQKGWTLA